MSQMTRFRSACYLAVSGKAKRKRTLPQVVNKSKKGFGKAKEAQPAEEGLDAQEEFEQESLIFALEFIEEYAVRHYLE